MPESLAEIDTYGLKYTQDFAGGLTQLWTLKFMLVFVFHDTLQEFVSKQIVRFYNNCNQNDLMQNRMLFFTILTFFFLHSHLLLIFFLHLSYKTLVLILVLGFENNVEYFEAFI